MATIDKGKKDLDERQRVGIRRYGVSVDIPKVSARRWLRDAYMEALDCAIYLRRAIDVLDEENEKR